jgi:hypothetical protein
MVFVNDPTDVKFSGKPKYFYYQRIGTDHYYLRGVGPDGLPFTPDDLLPQVQLTPGSKLGLLIERAEQPDLAPAKSTENQQALPSPAQAPYRNTDATAFASIAEREVSQLHEGITLATWMYAQGKPEGWQKTPERKIEPTDWPRHECLSYVKEEALPAQITRAFYFYPPPAPSPASFPAQNGQELINTCVLAMIRVEAGASTPEIAHALDQAAQQRLARQYGESIGMKDVAFWGPGSRLYKDSARWIRDAEIVSGYDSQGLYIPDQSPLVSGPIVFVRARLPLVQKLEYGSPGGFKSRSFENAQFHRAIALVGADAAVSGRLETLYEQVLKASSSAEEAQRPGKWRESLLPLLQEWFTTLKTVPPVRRAAGLLAVDSLLKVAGTAGEIPGWPDKLDKQSGLQELGAVFQMNGSTGDYLYTGNLQKQARGLDPDGSLGQMATISSMGWGWCEVAGSDLFRKVILEGEGLLAKGLDPPTAAHVHFMAGDAYSDIVAIAGGESGGNGEYESGQFEGEADSARAKALAHYRAGLAVDNSSENAKDAWRQAWHLAAGLLPSERYVCFGD